MGGLMENNYMLNPAIKERLDAIIPGCLEKEVQRAVDGILWTVFPAQSHWWVDSRYDQGDTEPDNVVSKWKYFVAGWADVNVLMVEIKRPQEDISLEAFNDIAKRYLDDHMAQSNNHQGTTLFGAVVLGHYVVFYQRVLPRENLFARHPQPLHLELDASIIQTQHFDYFKQNIPPSHAPSTSQPGQSYMQETHGSNEGYGTAGPTAPAASSQAEPSGPHYYVEHGVYYYFDGANHIRQEERHGPKDVWVWNRNGWSETDRTQFWRKQDGHNVEYW